MKPYYDDGQITLYCADARDVLPDLKADVVLTDPPYNAKNMGAHCRQYKDSAFPMSEEEYQAFCLDWFFAAASASDRMCFTPGIGGAWNYPPPFWVLCWNKPSAVSYNRMQGFNIWEPILLYGKFRPGFTQDAFTLVPKNFSTGPEKKHPCPKPMELWQWLVQGISKEGETLLDPFCGSGTTLRAAKNLGRKAIGIEVVEEYCEIAVKRLAQEVLPL